MEDTEQPTPMTVCPTCDGNGQVPVPTLVIIEDEPHSVLAPRACRQCRESDNPGWLPGLRPPM